MKPAPKVRMLEAGIRIASAVVLALLVGGAFEARAQKEKGTQIETEAEFLRYDAAAHTITVKVIKPGKGATPPRELKLRQGQEAAFRVKEEGSVLSRTTVKLQSGVAGAFTDLEAGRKVRVFWIPDPNDKQARFARSVSVFVPAEEQGEDAGD
jgi:hypothetical protein